MSGHRLFRTGGYAAMIAGVLLLPADIWRFVDFLRYGDSIPFNEAALSTMWTVSSAAYLVGGLSLMLALVGLYIRQADEAGMLGFVGFVAALAGTGMIMGVLWVSFFVAPSLAIEAPAFLNNEEVKGPLNAGFAASHLALAFGWALFGFATFRARVYPRVAAMLLTAGALFTLAPLPAIAPLMAFALLWMGAVAVRVMADGPEVEPVEAHPQAH